MMPAPMSEPFFFFFCKNNVYVFSNFFVLGHLLLVLVVFQSFLLVRLELLSSAVSEYGGKRGDVSDKEKR